MLEWRKKERQSTCRDWAFLFLCKNIGVKEDKVVRITFGFPERCRKSVERVSETLNTDYHSAYTMILLMACLMDYSPDDPEVVDELLANYTKPAVSA